VYVVQYVEVITWLFQLSYSKHDIAYFKMVAVG